MSDEIEVQDVIDNVETGLCNKGSNVQSGKLWLKGAYYIRGVSLNIK